MCMKNEGDRVMLQSLRAIAKLVIFGMVLTSVSQAGEFHDSLAGFASEIAKILKDEKQNQVAIAEFAGPPSPKTSTGPMIQQGLINELNELKIQVNQDAFVIAGGDFRVLQQKPDFLEVRITIRIETKSGKRLDEIVKDIGFKSNEDIVKLLAMNTNQSRIMNADRETVNKHLKKELKSPPVALEDSMVKTGKQSPYAVEILHRKAGNESAMHEFLVPVLQSGMAAVDVPSGNEYIIRLHNRSTYEAAITLTIDGVDLFQFHAPDGRRPTMCLVPAGKSMDVEGWPFGRGKAKAFLVGGFADAAANKVLKGSSSIGTITAAFHPAWQGPTPEEFAGTRSSQSNATGFGREFQQNQGVVERKIGPLFEAISLRYAK